jgi:hypothetical protein
MQQTASVKWGQYGLTKPKKKKKMLASVMV